MEASERSLRRRSEGERGLEPSKRASASPAKGLSFSAIRTETIGGRESENFERERERE